MRMSKRVAERTKGSVKVEVFHNSQLGDTRDMLDQARAGANVGTVTDVARLGSFVPSLSGRPRLMAGTSPARTTDDLPLPDAPTTASKRRPRSGANHATSLPISRSRP